MDSRGERDWANLPWDILSLVFDKLGAVEIFCSAQTVCSSWWKLSLEPHFWKRLYLCPAYFLDRNRLDKVRTDQQLLVDFHRGLYFLEDEGRQIKDDLSMLFSSSTKRAMNLIAFAAERCNGNLVEISINEIADDNMLKLITGRVRGLKQLRLFHCSLSVEVMIKAFSNLTSLEELAIVDCDVGGKDHYPRPPFCYLNSCPKDPHRNDVAFVIAKNMTHLCELQLFDIGIDKVGFLALLDGCPKLESLRLGNIDLFIDKELRMKCTRRLKCLEDYPIHGKAEHDDFLFRIFSDLVYGIMF